MSNLKVRAMSVMLHSEPPPRRDLTQVTEEVRLAVREFSPDQMLDLADMLHDLIRERRSGRAVGVRAVRGSQR